MIVHRSRISINHKQVKPEIPVPELDGYEKKIIDFIRSWLQGDAAFELQTSGSTGVAKTIRATRQQMEASANATLSFLQIEANTPVTVCIDARYIGGKMQLVRALVHNLPLQIVSPSSDPQSHLQSFSDLGLISLVPLQLYSLLDSGSDILNKAKVVLVGGGPVNEDYLPAIQKLKPLVYHTYGMTETLSHIALRLLNHAPSDRFHPLPGIVLGQDDRGCLLISGEVTGFRTLVTNDVVELAEDGSFSWKGRYDEVVNSGGIKIFPEEVDKLINATVKRFYPHCQFFSYGIPHPRLGQQLVLFIEVNQPLVPEKEIIDQLKAVLPEYHAPKKIFCVPVFKTSASGKTHKRETAFSVLN